ncbi:MAG: GNAT family N-acetyltransferase [Methylococcaceae bacterium]
MLELVDYDIEFLKLSWKWLNDEEIKQLTMTPNFTKEQQVEFFNSLARRKDYLIYGISFNNNKIGACGLKNIDNEQAEYWGYIGEKEYWGQGIGKRILEIMIKKTLDMQLKYIFLKVKFDNTRAINLYKKTGFVIKEDIGDYLVMSKDIKFLT